MVAIACLLIIFVFLYVYCRSYLCCLRERRLHIKKRVTSSTKKRIGTVTPVDYSDYGYDHDKGYIGSPAQVLTVRKRDGTSRGWLEMRIHDAAKRQKYSRYFFILLPGQHELLYYQRKFLEP